MMETLLEIEVGIEAGVWTIEDADHLGASGLGGQVMRILVEPGKMQVGESVADALKLVEDIHRTLDRYGLTAPRLQHGDGKVTWVILTAAVRCGLDTRIGLEDTPYEPDGAVGHEMGGPSMEQAGGRPVQSNGSAPGALPYTAVRTVAVGAHRAAILLNARPTSAPVA